MRALLVLVPCVACGGPATAVSPVATATAAPVNRGSAPCFPDRHAIQSADVLEALQPYLDGERQGPAQFGNCTFDDGMLVAADGTELVEEDACQVAVRVAKIRDDFGVEVGMLGYDVLARRSGDSFFCERRFETICGFYVDGALDATQYVVTGSLDRDGVTEHDAVEFFAPLAIWRIVIRTCDV